VQPECGSTFPKPCFLFTRWGDDFASPQLA
jgi:hypothetical protein